MGGLHSPTRGGTYQKPLGKPENPDSAHSATPTTSHHTTFSDDSELQWMSSEQKRRAGDGERNKPDKVKQWKQTEETRNDDHSPPKSLFHIQTTSPETQIIKKTEPEPTVPGKRAVERWAAITWSRHIHSGQLYTALQTHSSYIYIPVVNLIYVENRRNN